jgi:hypothetical protein
LSASLESLSVGTKNFERRIEQVGRVVLRENSKERLTRRLETGTAPLKLFSSGWEEAPTWETRGMPVAVRGGGGDRGGLFV